MLTIHKAKQYIGNFKLSSSKFIYEIGRQLSNVSGYLLESTPYSSGFAGYKDWFIQNYNLPGYTIESGIEKTLFLFLQFQDIYDKNIGILILSMLLA